MISTKYEDDEFRRYVQRNLDHFEKLLSEANESDPENLLSSDGCGQAGPVARAGRGAVELGTAPYAGPALPGPFQTPLDSAHSDMAKPFLCMR